MEYLLLGRGQSEVGVVKFAHSAALRNKYVPTPYFIPAYVTEGQQEKPPWLPHRGIYLSKKRSFFSAGN